MSVPHISDTGTNKAQEKNLPGLHPPLLIIQGRRKQTLGAVRTQITTQKNKDNW